MTLKEVAKIAGVSPSTVSRIINSKGGKCASEAVRKRVWDAIIKTGYTPNQAAKQLKSGQTENIDTPTISILFARSKDSRDDSYFFELSNYVKQEILRNGCKVGPQYSNIEARNVDISAIKAGKKDGLIVLGKTDGNLSPLLSLFDKRIAFITLNQMYITEDHVMCDGVEATKRAMQYLYDNGHRRIAYIGEIQKEIRYKSYIEFFIKAKLRCEEEHIINAPMTTKSGYSAAKKILKCKELPSAIFCANDATAIGVLKGLKDNDIVVPRDISVISIDDIAEASLSEPPLTTIKIPLKELGCFAVNTLLNRIHKRHKVHLDIFMPSELIIRQSVRKV
jgi:DNA-binding LacI/PurR family transcriptional regulator